ncbi:MAG: ABC transporter ATP-binding protein [Eubacterium sp.]|nr:ABC transporter ATP-binding protein [Eubacterium sp.]
MLKIEHLTKHYKGSKKGVTDLSLHIAPGDLYAFIGHNGAGKTTTLKCVTGIQDFDAGAIQVCGTDIRKYPVLCKQQFAYIPDNPDIYEYLTGIQYLNFTADVFGVGARERAERIRTYGDLFEITESLGDLVSAYSHGMKQKLALLSALVHEPKLLILDEPFVGLDPKASVILKGLMRETCEKGGAIFFSTHVLEVAEKLCNKVAMIKDGTLVAAGEMEEVLKQGQSLESVFMEVAADDAAD